MNPVEFPQANQTFGPPKDLVESQCHSIPAFIGQVVGGAVDGVPLVVVAWRPTDEEIEMIRQGRSIFLTMIGGLTPHYLSMDFKTATHPV